MKVHRIDASHVVVTWDCMLIQLWRGEVTSTAIQELLELARALVEAQGEHSPSILTIIESRSPAPEQKVRAQLSACFNELAKGMRHQIFLSEGSGFRAALIRGVGLTVSALAPSLLPFKFAASLDEVGVTMAPHLSPSSGGPEGLKKVVSDLHAMLDAQAQS
jgi:hypothetical protein